MFEAVTGERKGLENGSVLGRYEIRERIGTGGFCNVYRAWDPAIGREVAVKTCESLQKPILERFAREARLAGGLDHPNIVRIHDFQDGEGPCFIVQEFLPGEDLEKRLGRKAEPISLPEKARILAEVARGLAHAHGQGVVHRDIKPANILLLPGGGVKILDFGIAKSLEDDRTMTRPGVTMGSLGYMAPEQIEGGEVDHRTDLFSLGILAYELFAGRRPFEAGSVDELFQRIIHDVPEPISATMPEVPVEFDAVILRCLSKSPLGRPDSAEEIREIFAGPSPENAPVV